MTRESKAAKNEREIKAILFADLTKSSHVTFAQLPLLFDHVLKPIGSIIKDHKSLDYLNTWGDGIFALFDDAVECCRFALQLRDHFNQDFEYVGLPRELGIRVAVHQGRILRFPHPMQKVKGAMGPAIVLAARIEPIVPRGQIWVTSQIRVALEAEGGAGMAADPLGTTLLAKDAGSWELFALRKIKEPVIRRKPELASIVQVADELDRANKLELVKRMYRRLAESKELPARCRSQLDELFGMVIDFCRQEEVR